LWSAGGLTEFAQQSDKSQGHQELGTFHSPIAIGIFYFRAISIFHAKESKRAPISDSQCEQQSPAMPKCPVDPNPGSSDIIYDYLASHPSPETLLREDSFTATDPTYDNVGRQWIMGLDERFLDSDGFLKGWDFDWENLGTPSTHRDGKLLYRDHVWVVTQTMVIFEHLALWAAHTSLTYKVYPGFWGRANPYHNHETGLMIQGPSHQAKVI
jgi:hypothetical protein